MKLSHIISRGSLSEPTEYYTLRKHTPWVASPLEKIPGSQGTHTPPTEDSGTYIYVLGQTSSWRNEHTCINRFHHGTRSFEVRDASLTMLEGRNKSPPGFDLIHYADGRTHLGSFTNNHQANTQMGSTTDFTSTSNMTPTHPISSTTMSRVRSSSSTTSSSLPILQPSPPITKLPMPKVSRTTLASSPYCGSPGYRPRSSMSVLRPTRLLTVCVKPSHSV
jgi:hypothetical protein